MIPNLGNFTYNDLEIPEKSSKYGIFGQKMSARCHGKPWQISNRYMAQNDRLICGLTWDPRKSAHFGPFEEKKRLQWAKTGQNCPDVWEFSLKMAKNHHFFGKIVQIIKENHFVILIYDYLTDFPCQKLISGFWGLFRGFKRIRSLCFWRAFWSDDFYRQF